MAVAAGLLTTSSVGVHRQNGYTAVHVATQCGHAEMVGLLLERGAGVNVQARNGLTALHLAAQDDRTNIARLLTRYAANIDPQTKVGRDACSRRIGL